MQKTPNAIRPFSVRALGLLTLAVVLLASSGIAQTTDPGRGVYRFASGAVGVTRSQSIHVTATSKNKWFPPCDITPGQYVGTVEMSVADEEGRELARATRRIEGCRVASLTVNLDDVMRGEGRMAVRASVKLIEVGDPTGAPPALAASVEVSDNATGKTTVLQSFGDPSPTPWVLSEQ